MKNILAVVKKSAIILACAAIAILAPIKAKAQGGASDMTAWRTVIIAPPLNTNVAGGTVGSFTNNWIDIRQFIGIVQVDLMVFTNLPGTITNKFQFANDETNLIVVSNWATHIQTNLTYTNIIFNGTNQGQYLATNQWLLPGLITNYTASVSGNNSWALIPSQYTNTPTFANSAGGHFIYWFEADDVPRFMQMATLVGGANTNYFVGCTMTGRTVQGPPNY